MHKSSMGRVSTRGTVKVHGVELVKNDKIVVEPKHDQLDFRFQTAEPLTASISEPAALHFAIQRER